MDILVALYDYYGTLFYFLRTGGDYIGCPSLTKPEQLQTKVHVYGLFLDLYLWNQPHYRAPTYRHDLSANLRNVAVPGTGLPLSFFCCNQVLAYFLIWILYPWVAFIGAINVARKVNAAEERVDALAAAFREHLLAPEDWFMFWRLNSRIAGYHELLTHSGGYRQEDKWTFLVDGEKLGVPVSPVLKVASIVVKNKNEEGGLGIYFYKNAMVGGDWIIQERLENSEFLKLLLPPNAPLSTLRVITASRGGLTPDDPRGGLSADDKSFAKGRAGANTDHSSILFDVDVKTGVIQEGSTNAHWYELGLTRPFTTSWRSSYVTKVHPDNNAPVAGTKIADIEGLLRLVRRAHFLMLPDVPFVGWDVALTSRGVYLLEVNLSCNFFRGSFDKVKYFSFCRDYLEYLQEKRTGENGSSSINSSSSSSSSNTKKDR